MEIIIQCERAIQLLQFDLPQVSNYMRFDNSLRKRLTRIFSKLESYAIAQKNINQQPQTRFSFDFSDERANLPQIMRLYCIITFQVGRTKYLCTQHLSNKCTLISTKLRQSTLSRRNINPARLNWSHFAMIYAAVCLQSGSGSRTAPIWTPQYKFKYRNSQFIAFAMMQFALQSEDISFGRLLLPLVFSKGHTACMAGQTFIGQQQFFPFHSQRCSVGQRISI
jgi:hypothetical protein